MVRRPKRAPDRCSTMQVTTIVLEAARLRPIVASPPAPPHHIDANVMIARLRLTDMDEVVVTATSHDPPTISAKLHHRRALADPTNVIKLMVTEKTTADTCLSTTMLEQDRASQVLGTTLPTLATDTSLHLSHTPIMNILPLSQAFMMILIAATVVASRTIMVIGLERTPLAQTSCTGNQVLLQYARVRAAMSKCMSFHSLSVIRI
jgi:hypothetical protein